MAKREEPRVEDTVVSGRLRNPASAAFKRFLVRDLEASVGEMSELTRKSLSNVPAGPLIELCELCKTLARGANI